MSEIPYREVSESFEMHHSNNDDWEIVEAEERHHNDENIALNRTPMFTWRYEFLLQTGTEASKHKCILSETSTAQNNNAASLCQQDQCSIFSLPFELRLRIYEQVLLILPAVQLMWHPRNSDKTVRPSVLSILETCRRIYTEAESIFYSINHFQFPIKNSPTSTPDFCQTINPIRRDAIRSLTISIFSGSALLLHIQKLTSLTKLRKLHIERRFPVRYIDVRSWAIMVKHLKMELEKFGELQGLQIVTPVTELPTREEEKRIQRLGEIDNQIQDVVRKITAPGF